MIGLCALVLAVTVQAQDFTRTMTEQERAAAGLEKLSAAELAKLKAFVERYKAGAVAVAQEEAEQKVAATEAKVKEAEQKAAVAEVKAKEAESKAASATAEKKAGPGWLSALVTLKKAEKDASNEPLESRLSGEFRGWRRGTMFELENGQRWQHVEGADYVTPPVSGPKVKITPGAFGTFWMRIEGVNARLRVKPVKLE